MVHCSQRRRSHNTTLQTLSLLRVKPFKHWNVCINEHQKSSLSRFVILLNMSSNEQRRLKVLVQGYADHKTTKGKTRIVGKYGPRVNKMEFQDIRPNSAGKWNEPCWGELRLNGQGWGQSFQVFVEAWHKNHLTGRWSKEYKVQPFEMS